MPRRAALYARVSTAEQHVEPQLHALRTYAAARGWRSPLSTWTTASRERRIAGLRSTSSWPTLGGGGSMYSL